MTAAAYINPLTGISPSTGGIKSKKKEENKFYAAASTSKAPVTPILSNNKKVSNPVNNKGIII